jgi:phosphatidylglycerol:prolipoprotein diacylglycerol transferase
MSPLFAFWVHQPHPFLFRFTESFGLRYYGLAYILGFVTGGWLFVRYWQAGRSQLPAAKVSDFIVALVVGVMLGGRIGSFVLYHPDQLLSDPLSFFRVWEGGMASHGGFVGVAIASWWFSRSQKIRFVHLGDLIVSAAPAGLFFGRIANFLNGELWGKPATVPWAMIFSATGGGPEPRHPSQLYEAALEGLFLFALMQWRFWRSDVIRRSPGQLSGEFLLSYAIVRAVCEVFREPDEGVSLILGLSRGTFYSVFLAAAGIAFIALATRSKPLEIPTATDATVGSGPAKR